ncbi:hypothetical protein BDN72DRAFT_866105, partial [Pluteus cervinus]
YLTVDPQIFRVGDVVEVQFSLVVYRMRGDNYICKPMLYSIALLEGKYGNELSSLNSPTKTSPMMAKALKRKVGYVVDANCDARLGGQQGMKHFRARDKEGETGAVQGAEPISQLEKMSLDS